MDSPMIFSEVWGRVELNHNISMETWPNPDKISALVSGVMGKQFKMNMCWGRNAWSRVWWGTILTRPCPKHSQTNICGWALRRTIVRGTTLSNIKGHVPKTNLNKPPSMPLHSPSRSVTLRHATSRSVTRFRQMTQFLKVKSRLFLKNHEKSRWITLRHATSRYVTLRHVFDMVHHGSSWHANTPDAIILPPYYHHLWAGNLMKASMDECHITGRNIIATIMYKTIAHVMFVWYYFIPFHTTKEHKST